MKVFMNVSQMRFFTKVLRFLARIGNEIYFEATKNHLILRAVNSSKTCFSSVYFLEHFFLSYHITGDKFDDNNCRVALRPLLSVLKNYKTFESCKIFIDARNEKLVFDITKPKNIHNVNSITILENENLEDMSLPKKEVSTLICQPSVLRNIVGAITSKSLREVAFNVTKDNFEVRNHISHPDKDVETVRLQYKFNPSEFTSYDVDKASYLIVPSQDFLTIVDFAEDVKEELKIIFTENGKPLIISVLTGDGATKVQMFVASMKEKDLKVSRKAPASKSYKEVVNGYLETRNSAVGLDQLELSLRQMSESEVHRTVSPNVDTFGGPNFASGSNLRMEITNPQKRKSNELLPNTIGDSGSVVEVAESFEQMKKQKLDAVLSQEEQEVSQIIADLENMESEVEEDLVSGNQQRNTSSLNFLDGMEKIKVLPQNLTSADTSDSDQTQFDDRFEKTKARFSTEDLKGDLSPNSTNSNRRSLRSSLQASNENQNPTRSKLLQVAKISELNQDLVSKFPSVMKPSKKNNNNEGKPMCDGNLEVKRW